MKLVIVGLGDDGRSCVKDVRSIWPETGHSAEAAVDATEIALLWKTHQFPFELPQPIPADESRRRDIDDAMDTTTAFMFVRFPPDRLGPFHRTETIDYDVVVAGSTALVLEDGEVELSVGDAVMLPGLIHRWRTGPAGCVLAVTGLAIASSADPTV